MIEAREPVEKENAMTPVIIKKTATIFSPIETAVMSPYPTVTIVVMVK